MSTIVKGSEDDWNEKRKKRKRTSATKLIENPEILILDDNSNDFLGDNNPSIDTNDINGCQGASFDTIIDVGDVCN